MRAICFCLFCILFNISTTRAQKKYVRPMKPFNHTIVIGGWIPGTGFSRICDWAYIIDNKKVEIHYHYMDSGIVNRYSKNINNDGVIDSLVLSMPLKYSENLEKFSDFQFNMLGEEYVNPDSRIDGLHYTFILSQDTVVRNITVNDYYVPELENFVTLFNTLIPKEWQIWYHDSDGMLSDEKTGILKK